MIDIAFKNPKSPLGNIFNFPRPNIKNISVVHSPTPFIEINFSLVSASLNLLIFLMNFLF
ncbi:uncharacterized protein METZ01_LOCUS515955 [marine metagenome]|uniref:Uncharacterized protein n=1 Tax=marine metagenome TaxID=408172 RepID=A0A383F285_9ZZZZ